MYDGLRMMEYGEEKWKEEKEEQETRDRRTSDGSRQRDQTAKPHVWW